MFLNHRKALILGVIFIIMLLSISCESFLKGKEEKQNPIARVGKKYLYKKDVSSLFYKGITKGDSATIVNDYINNWASKQLLLSKAKINLPEDKLAEFEALVANYRTDLYTRAYQEALIDKAQDSMVTSAQMKAFYEEEKENFRLKERIVKLRFIELPKQFLDKEEVIKRLKSFKEKDHKYLDSIGIQFKKLNFNDSLWVSSTRVLEEIPPLTIENQDKYLKNSQFFELEDALGVYLAKVTGVLEVNDIAPLSYIEPTIKQVLINRRKLDYIRKLETEIIDEAIKENEFEVYGKEK